MIKSVCDICHREVKQPATNLVHFCERCQPVAEKYISERTKVWEEANQELQRRLESFRNRFMRENVVKLEAVK